MTKPRLKVIAPIAAIIVLVWLPLFLGVPGALAPQTLWALFTGWFHFIGRTVPAVNWSGSALGFGVILSLVAVGGIQWLGTSMTRNTAGQKWKLGWSLAIYGTVWMLFLTAMSVTGALHQTIWLASSKEPFGVYRSGASSIALKMMAGGLLEQLALEKATLGQARKGLVETMVGNSVGTDRHFFDLYSVAFFGRDAGTNWTVLIVPRSGATSDKMIEIAGPLCPPWKERKVSDLSQAIAEIEALHQQTAIPSR